MELPVLLQTPKSKVSLQALGSFMTSSIDTLRDPLTRGLLKVSQMHFVSLVISSLMGVQQFAGGGTGPGVK